MLKRKFIICNKVASEGYVATEVKLLIQDEVNAANFYIRNTRVSIDV